MDHVILAAALVGCAVIVGMANKPRPNEVMGLQYLQEQKYPQAVSTLQQAVQDEGPTRASYLALAKASNEMHNYDSDLKYADLALKYFQENRLLGLNGQQRNLA